MQHFSTKQIICIQSYIHVYTHIQIHTYICIYVYMYMYIYVYILYVICIHNYGVEIIHLHSMTCPFTKKIAKPPSSTGDTWGHHAASPMDFLRWISGATPLLISSNYHSNGESGRESASEIHRFFGIFKRLGCSMPCDFLRGKSWEWFAAPLKIHGSTDGKKQRRKKTAEKIATLW
jgi:hypothetical protein